MLAHKKLAELEEQTIDKLSKIGSWPIMPPTAVQDGSEENPWDVDQSDNDNALSKSLKQRHVYKNIDG